MKNYLKYQTIYLVHDPVDDPSWMVDGSNKKLYFEAYARALAGELINPRTSAGLMGKQDGIKKRKLLNLINGKEDVEYVELPF